MMEDAIDKQYSVVLASSKRDVTPRSRRQIDNAVPYSAIGDGKGRAGKDRQSGERTHAGDLGPHAPGTCNTAER